MAPSSAPGSRANRSPSDQTTRFGSRKTSTQRNTSILQFFGKAETPPKPSSNQNRITEYIVKSERTNAETSWKRTEKNEARDCDGLFVEDARLMQKNEFTLKSQGSSGQRSQSPDDFWTSIGNPAPANHDLDDNRYHENGTAIKRVKLDFGSPEMNFIAGMKSESNPESNPSEGVPITEDSGSVSKDPAVRTLHEGPTYTGPFLIDSDNEHETGSPKRAAVLQRSPSFLVPSDWPTKLPDSAQKRESPDSLWGMEKAAEDYELGDEDCKDFEGFGDLSESHNLEACERILDDEDVAFCPICQRKLKGLTDVVSFYL